MLCGLTGEAAEQTATWLPSVGQLLEIANTEPFWDMAINGHPTIVAAHVHLRLGHASEAEEVARALLADVAAYGATDATPPLLKSAICRIDATLLLAEALATRGCVRDALSELEHAAQEGARVGFVLVEFVALRHMQLLGLHGQEQRDAEARLARVASRMDASAEELAELSASLQPWPRHAEGGDRWPGTTAEK